VRGSALVGNPGSAGLDLANPPLTTSRAGYRAASAGAALVGNPGSAGLDLANPPLTTSRAGYRAASAGAALVGDWGQHRVWSWRSRAEKCVLGAARKDNASRGRGAPELAGTRSVLWPRSAPAYPTLASAYLPPDSPAAQTVTWT
jgi:hypothetical protein